MDTNRREFLLAAAALSAAAISPGAAANKASSPAFQLEALPWDSGALAPVISRTTVELHYTRHHGGYLNNLNKLVAGTSLEELPLNGVIKAAAKDPALKSVFNNAAQVANHNFYWKSLVKNGGGQPPQSIMSLIKDSFGDLQSCKKKFLEAANTQFGSGWVWLVFDRSNRRLALVKTGNADTPASGNLQEPLAVLDVWEHAYYVDYQNKRGEYAEAVFDKLLNWRFAESNYGQIAG